MKRLTLSFLPATFLALSGVIPGHAQDEDGGLQSGPAPGAALTPVSCYATDGRLSGQEFDAAAKVGEAPGAFLFIHELTRNTAPVLRGLDDLATEFGILGFRSFTIMLSADRTAAEAQLKRVNGSLRLTNPIVLSTDGLEGPGNYALNRKAALTLILVKDGTVAKSLALTDTGPQDVPMIRKEIEALTGVIPEDPKALADLVAAQLPADAGALKELAARQAVELRRLREEVARLRQDARQAGMQRQPSRSQPMRPGGERPEARPTRPAPGERPPVQREGKPPEDPELLSLLRSYIRKTNDDERTEELFAGIKARGAESEPLRGEVVEMFRLMLSIDYGNARAQELAREFLEEHGPKRDGN